MAEICIDGDWNMNMLIENLRRGKIEGERIYGSCDSYRKDFLESFDKVLSSVYVVVFDNIRAK